MEVTNGLKGLDPKSAWRTMDEVCNIVHGAVIKTITKKKKCKKGKMVIWGGLTNSWEKKRSKRQRRKGMIYPSECSIPKNSREKTAFLSDEWKEIEENNRMGKIRDLFKKIRDTKGTLHTKMGTIKDRIGMDLTEAEDIKKRWQKHTEELYKKELNDPDNHDGVITHLEPDILECDSSGP